jgi:2'-5' RNA ligase
MLSRAGEKQHILRSAQDDSWGSFPTEVLNTPLIQSTMRSFIAINLPLLVKNEIGEIIERLKTSGTPARWVHQDNLHVTMKFLDEIDEDQVGPILGAITLAKSGTALFDLRLSGFGFFPNPNRARVFWVGIESGFEPLRALAKSIDREVHTLGFARETRSFAAHITLARVREPGPVERLARAASHVSYQSEPIPVTKIDLMKSVLSPKGAAYTVLGSVPLA